MSVDFIKKMAEILECNSSDLKNNTSFRNHPNWDSLALLSVMAMIDESYNVVIPHGDFEGLETVGDIARYIKQKQA